MCLASRSRTFKDRRKGAPFCASFTPQSRTNRRQHLRRLYDSFGSPGLVGNLHERKLSRRTDTPRTDISFVLCRHAQQPTERQHSTEWWHHPTAQFQENGQLGALCLLTTSQFSTTRQMPLHTGPQLHFYRLASKMVDKTTCTLQASDLKHVFLEQGSTTPTRRHIYLLHAPPSSTFT